MSEHSREDAYRLDGPAAHRDYYDAWAASYDTDFIAARGYQVPTAVARAFLAFATPADSPVADLGCGTGQLGRALGLPEVDGFDVSPAMLAQAEATGAYRALHQVDLTADAAAVAAYGGLVSSGTFTHGHLGSADLPGVLGMCRPGALCVLGINAGHFAEAGFSGALGGLADHGRITLLDETEVASYDDDSLADEPVNRTRSVVLRTCG